MQLSLWLKGITFYQKLFLENKRVMGGGIPGHSLKKTKNNPPLPKRETTVMTWKAEIAQSV
jgi:hypothetical protein